MMADVWHLNPAIRPGFRSHAKVRKWQEADTAPEFVRPGQPLSFAQASIIQGRSAWQNSCMHQPASAKPTRLEKCSWNALSDRSNHRLSCVIAGKLPTFAVSFNQWLVPSFNRWLVPSLAEDIDFHERHGFCTAMSFSTPLTRPHSRAHI